MNQYAISMPCKVTVLANPRFRCAETWTRGGWPRENNTRQPDGETGIMLTNSAQKEFPRKTIKRHQTTTTICHGSSDLFVPCATAMVWMPHLQTRSLAGTRRRIPHPIQLSSFLALYAPNLKVQLFSRLCLYFLCYFLSAKS